LRILGAVRDLPSAETRGFTSVFMLRFDLAPAGARFVASRPRDIASGVAHMTDIQTETVCESEIEFLARAIIAQHGPTAAYAAESHLDQLVKWNSSRCDTWTAVIDAIHLQRCREAGASPPFG
jgi:hypothetical protein